MLEEGITIEELALSDNAKWFLTLTLEKRIGALVPYIPSLEDLASRQEWIVFIDLEEKPSLADFWVDEGVVFYEKGWFQSNEERESQLRQSEKIKILGLNFSEDQQEALRKVLDLDNIN